jgi:hypothetical protein
VIFSGYFLVWTTYAVFLIPITLFDMLIFAYISEFLAKKQLFTLIKDLEDFNIFWKKNIQNIQNINEILNWIEVIHKKINKITLLTKYALFKNSMYKNLHKNEIEYFLEILTNLRSDLSIRLAEQQSLLESAKWEVEKNIKWTSELNQVSELQKIRLDKQIEQFEELQRVLVKV